MTSIINKRGNTTSAADIRRTIRKYYKWLYSHKCDNSDEMDQFIGSHKLQKSIQESTYPLPVVMENGTTILENSLAVSYKVKNPSYNPVIPVLGIYPRDMKS